MCDKEGRGATICLFSLGNRCLLKWVRSRISEGRGGSGWRLSSALANKWAHAQTSVCVNFCDFFRYFPFSLSFFPFLVVSPSPPPSSHTHAQTQALFPPSGGSAGGEQGGPPSFAQASPSVRAGPQWVGSQTRADPVLPPPPLPLCPHPSLSLSFNKHLTSPNDAPGAGPGPGAQGPEDSGVSLWESGAERERLLLDDGQEWKSSQHLSALSWRFLVWSLPFLLPSSRNTGTRVPERPGFTPQLCLFQADRICRKKWLPLSGLCISWSQVVVLRLGWWEVEIRE